MKSKILFSSSKMNWIAVELMAIQLVFKLTLEIGKALETANTGVVAVAIAFTIGWIVIIALCITGFRVGYWLGAIWGLLHFVMTAQLPLTHVCDHYTIAAIVMLHGILIAAACLFVLRTDARKDGTDAYRGMRKSDVWGFILLCASVLVRTLWITFREPVGAAIAQAAIAGKGGLPEIAANSLIYVVVVSMAALCVIIPGIVMRKRWAFTSAAIFGGIHTVITLLNVVLHVNQGFGPSVVIPASLGLLIGGIWMMNSQSRKNEINAHQFSLTQ